MPPTPRTRKEPADAPAPGGGPPKPTSRLDPAIFTDDGKAELREALGIVDLEQDVNGLAEAVEHPAVTLDQLEAMKTSWRSLLEQVDRLASSVDGQLYPAMPARLLGKLADVMGTVERVPKSGHNSFHNYDYATEADVADLLRSELATRKVMLVPRYHGHRREEHEPTSKGRAQWLHYVDLDLTFYDAENGEQFVSGGWWGVGIDSDDKGFYKAMTGAMKYALLKTFMVSTGDDPENDQRQREANTGGDRQQRRARPTAQAIDEMPLTESMIRKLHAEIRDAGADHDELNRIIAWKTQGQARGVKELQRRHFEPLLGSIASYKAHTENAVAMLDVYFSDHPEHHPDDEPATPQAVVAGAEQAAADARASEDLPFEGAPGPGYTDDPNADNFDDDDRDEDAGGYPG